MTPNSQLPSLSSSVSSTYCSSTERQHMKRPSDTSSLPQHHTWWDESQLDLDLADDSIIIGGTEDQLSKKQRLKQKLITTMKYHHHHHPHHHLHINDNSNPNNSIANNNHDHDHHHSKHRQRTSWMSNSSSNSSLSSSTHSISTTSLASSYSKLSRPFSQLKHLLKKH